MIPTPELGSRGPGHPRSREARLLGTWLLVSVGVAAALFPLACGGGDGEALDDPTEPILAEWVPGHYGDWFDLGAGSEPLNLLLISIDTTRRDHLSVYGFEKPTTPRLEELASEGVVFERASAPTPVTLPSHTTMMTGLYPFHHGVRNNGSYVVGDSLQTIAESLQGRGYRTGAIVGAFPVAHQFGLNQGFDHYDDEFPTTSTARRADTAQRRATDVTDLSLQWLDEPSDEPFFLWSHYFDPHNPYDPPEPHKSLFPDDPYSGEIHYADAEIGRLLDGLSSRGLLEKTVILVVADHGEGLGEHREMTHSFFVYGSTQSVPFLLRLPNTPPFADHKWRGRRIPDMVGLVDLLPTALHALGLPQRETPKVDGKSLLPVVAKRTPGHSWVYHETLVPRLEYGTAELRSLERRQYKYIRAPRRELYDLPNDPGETNNIAQRDSWVADEMEQGLSDLLRNEGDSRPHTTMDKETIAQLRSLGYLAGTDSPSADDENLADPKDMIWALEAVNTARSYMAGFRFAEALALVDSVLAANPRDFTAGRIRAAAYLRMERGEEAIEAFDALLAKCDGCADQYELLRDRALASMVAGQYDDALARIRAMRESAPDDADLARIEATILKRDSGAGSAREVLRDAVERDPNDADAWASLGELEFDEGNLPAAEQAYQRALEIQPNHVAALLGTVEILLPRGETERARTLTELAYQGDKNHPMALFRMGWFARLDGRLQQAIEFYQRSLAAEPENPAAWHNLGNIFLGLNRNTEAMSAFQRAIDTGAASQETYVNLGVLYAKQGRMTDAIANWEEAIRRDPDNPTVPQIRSNIQRARGM
ncbi:MAG: sulfatase-like hydrolase/transferase [Candidatus Eisenbacteria bacterium]|uniref:Sulfatase-like hydrolase/transferase n=1 Tax=Eiseniibacteriota bacterium TaxID=2212470 RepID=A0A956NB97_UNCEI|nr:sulfatase-like hydrolase/transferase [Candidatus Eisenbacteria bacterium]MCB9463593.1 sulfatase-like hydrolase/transferase [Candidatus Eisenbacteria bacterium]